MIQLILEHLRVCPTVNTGQRMWPPPSTDLTMVPSRTPYQLQDNMSRTYRYRFSEIAKCRAARAKEETSQIKTAQKWGGCSLNASIRNVWPFSLSYIDVKKWETRRFEYCTAQSHRKFWSWTGKYWLLAIDESRQVKCVQMLFNNWWQSVWK